MCVVGFQPSDICSFFDAYTNSLGAYGRNYRNSRGEWVSSVASAANNSGDCQKFFLSNCCQRMDPVQELEQHLIAFDMANILSTNRSSIEIMYFVGPPTLKIVYVVTFPEPFCVYHDVDWVRLCVVFVLLSGSPVPIARDSRLSLERTLSDFISHFEHYTKHFTLERVCVCVFVYFLQIVWELVCFYWAARAPITIAIRFSVLSHN